MSQISRDLPVVLRVSEAVPTRTKPSIQHKHWSTFGVQDFKEWFVWFFSQDKIEDMMDGWADTIQLGVGDLVKDYAQSRSKEYLYSSSLTKKSWYHDSLELSFSIFVDWFNPLTNKIAGRQVYLGIIALNC